MKRNHMTLAAAAVVAVLLLSSLGAPRASADTFTSTLTTGNAALSGLSSPFGTVLIDVTGGVATVTFTAANSYTFGDGGAVDLNLTKTGITASGFSWTGGKTPPNGTAFTSAGPGNVDGFGNFNLTINDFGGFTQSVTSVMFTLSGTWTDAASVLAFNSKGWDAAAHIFANGGAVTGYAGEGAGTIPDGGVTLMLLGGVLVSLETLRRKFLV